MPSHHLSEEEARRLWARAAQLQEEARLRASSKEIPAPTERGGGPTGYALEHVREAATEAGIDGRFLDEAFDEVRAGIRVAGPGLDRHITRFLGPGDRVLEAVRVIRAPAEVVLDAIYTVFTSDQSKLILLDQTGGHPLDGGALVFKAAGYDHTTPVGSAVMWSDIKEFIVRIREIDPESTEVKIRCPLEHSRKMNFGVGTILNGFVALGGGTAAVAGVTALGGALPLVLGGAAAAGAASWLVGKRGYRRMYRYALGKGRDGMQALLGQLAVYVETRSRSTMRGARSALELPSTSGGPQGEAGADPA
ncbi:MAG: hypothetical protein HKN73_20970 [Gemmatimonadetes bacterium]|nr:hypothetical protein [Gemmatimonadota bacterium]